MIIRLVSIFILALFTVAPVSGKSIRDCFAQMPDSLMPLLTKTNRLDMIDFIDSNMKAVVTNRLDGVSEMSFLSDIYISLKYTEKSDYQIRLFFNKDSVPLICMVHTVISDIYQDSELQFFDNDWNKIETVKLIKEPVFYGFIKKTSLKSGSLDIINKEITLKFQYIEALTESPVLRFRFIGLEHVGNDTLIISDYFINEPLEFLWKGKKFKRIRN